MSADELRALISECGFNNSSFAREIGVRPFSVRRWLSGRYPVPYWVSRFAAPQLRLESDKPQNN